MRKPLKRYYLEMSEDAGSTYEIAAESNDLEELLALGEALDRDWTRWVIKDRWLGAQVAACKIHLDMLNALKHLQGEEPLPKEGVGSFKVPWHQVDTYESRRFLTREATKRRRATFSKMAKEMGYGKRRP